MGTTAENNWYVRVYFVLIFVAYALELIFSNDIFSTVFLYSGDAVFLISIVYFVLFFSIRSDSYKIILFSFLYIFFSIISTYYSDRSVLLGLKLPLRILLPIIVTFQIFSLRYSCEYKKAIKYLSVFVLILIHILLIVAFVKFPHSINRGELWAPAYFRGLHSTAYVVLSSYFIFLAILRYCGVYKPKWDVLCFLVTVYYIAALFGVRTALLSLVAFEFLWCVYLLRGRYLILMIASFSLGALLFLGIAIDPFGDGFSLSNYTTSGRLGMYLEKLNQLSRNGLPQWLVGNGVGSDLIVTDVWWWGTKGAHCDYITFLVENGLVGCFFLFLIFKIFLYNLIDESEYFVIIIFMFLAFLLSSTFSNGIIVRPVASYVFFLSLVVLASVGYSEESIKQ